MIQSDEEGLIGKAVFTNEGAILGTIDNFNLDEKTGQIESIKIKPTEKSLIPKKDQLDTAYDVPSSCFIPVKNIIILEETPTQIRQKL